MNRKVVINVHAIIPVSRINGPGKRMVIFFQGCARRCSGCFNPETHPFEKKNLYTPMELLKRFTYPGIEGITISGGEPFHQQEGLYHLLREARDNYNLSTIIYTGFSYEDILRMKWGKSILTFTDVLIDGTFEEDKKEKTLLARGSTNQRFIFLTSRYGEEDFYMPGKIEIHVLPDGSIVKTGFSNVELLKLSA